MARKNPLGLAFYMLLCFLNFSKSSCPSKWFSYSYLSRAFLLSLLLFSGCNSTLDKQQYIKWIRDYDNNIHVRTSVSGFIFDVQYQPSEYVLLQRGITTLPEDVLVRELKKMDGIQYYTFILSTAEGKDLVSYGSASEIEKQQKEYYFSYQFQNDITLEEDGKVFPCILYHFEKLRSVDGGRTFILGFENTGKDASEAKLVVRSAMLSSLPVKIKIVKSDIPNVDL